jgi:hypothetical protein
MAFLSFGSSTCAVVGVFVAEEGCIGPLPLDSLAGRLSFSAVRNFAGIEAEACSCGSPSVDFGGLAEPCCWYLEGTEVGLWPNESLQAAGSA